MKYVIKSGIYNDDKRFVVENTKTPETTIKIIQALLIDKRTDVITIRKDLAYGGFSEAICKVQALQEYMRQYPVFGYIGAYNRTEERDKILETKLREAVKNTEQVAAWLMSTTGRHLMDGLTDCTTAEEFEEIVDTFLEREKKEALGE